MRVVASVPLYGPVSHRFKRRRGDAADGLKTTLHYADDLDNPADKAFRAAYQKRYGAEPDVYAVQGYDAAALLVLGMDAAKGDVNAKDPLYAAIRGAKLNSPRGPMTMSAANNPIQNIYLREVKNGKNAYVKIAAEGLSDPGTGCKMVNPPRLRKPVGAASRGDESVFTALCVESLRGRQDVTTWRRQNSSSPFFLRPALNVQYSSFSIWWLVLTLLLGITGVNSAHGHTVAPAGCRGPASGKRLARRRDRAGLALGALGNAFCSRSKVHHLSQVLLSFGLILIINEGQRIIFGNDPHGIDVPPALNFSIPLSDTFAYPAYRLFVCAIGIAFAVGVSLVMARTRIGMMLRASAENRPMARALGVNAKRMYLGVTAAGIACAVLAGVIAAPIASVYPGMGDQVLIQSFVVIVLGGIGSLPGALVGAMLLGLVDAFGKQFFPNFAAFLVYAAMIAVLIARRKARFGEPARARSRRRKLADPQWRRCWCRSLVGYEIKLATTITIQAVSRSRLVRGRSGRADQPRPRRVLAELRPICSRWWAESEPAT